MKTHKSYWLPAIVMITGVVLTACGGAATTAAPTATPTATPEPEPPFFTFANAGSGVPSITEFANGVTSAAEAAGVRLKAYDNNFDGETALRNAQLMVQDGPDVAIVFNVIEGVGGPIGQTFTDADIPCLAVNVPIPGCAWFNLSNKDLAIDTGMVMAEIAKEKGWTGADTTVVLVQDALAGDEVNHAVTYFYPTVAENLPGMEFVAESDITPETTVVGENLIQVDGKQMVEESYTAVKNVLQTIPAERHIIIQTPSDDSAMGAWRAIEEVNRQENTLISGLAGSSDGLTQLRTNQSWVAEGDIFVPYWGQYLIAMGLEILKGDTPPERTAAPQIVLTKETVDEFYPPDGFTPRFLPPLHPDNAYLSDSEFLKQMGMIQGINE